MSNNNRSKSRKKLQVCNGNDKILRRMNESTSQAVEAAAAATAGDRARDESVSPTLPRDGGGAGPPGAEGPAARGLHNGTAGGTRAGNGSAAAANRGGGTEQVCS